MLGPLFTIHYVTQFSLDLRLSNFLEKEAASDKKMCDIKLKKNVYASHKYHLHPRYSVNIVQITYKYIHDVRECSGLEQGCVYN